nr:hypothetical protein [Candidatus Sigynarchaeota archaeon]
MGSPDKDLIELIEEEADQLGLPKEPSVSLFGQPAKIFGGKKLPSGVFFNVDKEFNPRADTPAHAIDTPEYITGFMETELQLKRYSPSTSFKELQDGPYYARFAEPFTNLTYTFSPEPLLLVVVTGKSPVLPVLSVKDFAFALDIYAIEASLPRAIARYVNSQYEKGILAYSNWGRVQQLFNVNSKDCIEAWRKVLED